MLSVKTFVFNPFQENTYVLYDETKKCVIVDPGCYETDEQRELVDFIRGESLTVTHLLNTHCHVDHVLGNYFVKEKFGVKLYMHRKDEPVLKSVKVYASNYGFFQYQETNPDVFLEEGETINVGEHSMDILFVPGHAP